MDTDSEISALRERLAALDRERAAVARRVSALELPKNPGCTIPIEFAAVNAESPKAHKIALFRRLFKGRLDVFPRRFESAVSGKVGYAPACRNDFVKGKCGKPKIKCGQCTNQAFIPVGRSTARVCDIFIAGAFADVGIRTHSIFRHRGADAWKAL